MAFAHDRYAHEYDSQVIRYNCFIADALFGLMYEYTKPGDTILDVGIGTGIASRLFHKAGLQIYGIDASGEMLKICREKQFAQHLIKHDLVNLPWPYQDTMFLHVVCCGVLYFFGDLGKIFTEINRIQKSGGILAFTLLECDSKQNEDERFSSWKEDDLKFYAHHENYLLDLMKKNQYQIEKQAILLVGPNKFKAVICKK